MDKPVKQPSKKLFSVPIYFRSRDEHHKYFEAKWVQFLKQRISHHRQLSKGITEKDKKKWDIEFKHTHYHFWKYAEIIGYVEFRKKVDALYVFVIMAETEKYAPIINKKTFRIFDKIEPYKIPIADVTNEVIVKAIYLTLKKINNTNERFKKYYIDTSEIDNFVHLIDFHRI